MEKQHWGWHLSVDASQCNLAKITDGENIRNFSNQLVKDIDMVAYGEPQIINFGSGDKQGYTLVQLIETSNICAHFANELNAIFLDVFSCKEFDKETVKRLVVEYFDAGELQTYYNERGIG
jgi:S-adenosylmethionine/arginine decarboxylase-like enzyme